MHEVVAGATERDKSTSRNHPKGSGGASASRDYAAAPTTMDFHQLHQSWQKLGATDPRWAILSDPGRKGGGWEDDAFWHSGLEVGRWIARHLEGIDVVPRRDRALDFGCGIGRLSQALASFFDRVVGVDIAESMLEGARRFNRFGDRVEYVHNAQPDLRVFDDASFDFVLTLIVLQHMRPEYSAGYLREFLRAPRPGGVLYFQIPIEPFAGFAPTTTERTDGTAADSPLALAASCSLLPPQRDLAASEAQWYRIEVHNPGPHRLVASGPDAVEIGIRIDRFDGSAASKMEWHPLPHDLAPGERCSVLATVRAPAEPGLYVVAAQAGFRRTWLPHTRNMTAFSRLSVGPIANGRSNLPPPPPPVLAAPDGNELIEVYGTKIEDLYATITGAGGEVVDLALDAWAGYEWVSCHCTVRKK